MDIFDTKKCDGFDLRDTELIEEKIDYGLAKTCGAWREEKDDGYVQAGDTTHVDGVHPEFWNAIQKVDVGNSQLLKDCEDRDEV